MFLATDHSKHTDPALPRGCTFQPAEWHILAAFWHPIAYSHEVTDKPVSARLLDVDLVLYRTSSGITVAKDLCMHRGTKISLGRLSDDRLVCPMHGLQYDHEGVCRKIPSIADPNAKIPDKLRLQTYQSVERYGVIWTCLKDEAVWPLPEWPALEHSGWKIMHVPRDTWHAAASRHVENFNDLAHFPWVHGGTFGDEIDATVPPYEVEATDFGLRFVYPYLEGGNRFPDPEGAGLENREVVYTYELTYPFSTLIEVDVLNSGFTHYFHDTVSPASATETRIFQILTDTTGDPETARWLADALHINGEDKPLVEGQHPEELPLDLREEVHIPADRMSLAYRKAMATRFGLGAPLTS